MTKLSSAESSMIFSIYNSRHNINEIIFILPLIVAMFFTMIGAPIIYVCCNLSLLWNIILFVCPIPITTLVYLIRKKIIFDHFLKEKNIDNKVEISFCAPNLYESKDAARIFMFDNSENMPTIIYNWFNDLGVLKNGILKMNRIIYDNRAICYLSVDMDDLQISEEVLNDFEKETAGCIRFSDVDELGRTVNIRVYSRLTGIK